MKPWVAPEKRPSVIRATVSPRPSPDEGGGDGEHLPHARAPCGALSADHDDVALVDLVGEHCGHRRLLALEHPGRAHVFAALVPGELDDAAVGGDVPAQDREAAGGFERLGERL